MIYDTFCSFYFGHYVVCPSLYDLLNQKQESSVTIKLQLMEISIRHHRFYASISYKTFFFQNIIVKSCLSGF
jgi:hypothetical protein